MEIDLQVAQVPEASCCIAGKRYCVCRNDGILSSLWRWFGLWFGRTGSTLVCSFGADGQGAVTYPVVSYAPRPMFMEAMSSLRIIGDGSLDSKSAKDRWDTVPLYSDNRNAVAQGTGLDLLSQGQRGPDRKSGLKVTSDKRRMQTWSLSLLSRRWVDRLIDPGQPVRRIRSKASAGMQTGLFAMCALVDLLAGVRYWSSVRLFGSQEGRRSWTERRGER